MKIEKFYKVTYTNHHGTQSFIGCYEGIEDGDYVDCVECEMCGTENHRRMHQFNIPYDENGTVEEMNAQLDRGEYQTLYFGTVCIKKCSIEEIN